MSEEELLNYINGLIVSVSKKATESKDKKIKGIHPLYQKSVDMVESISYHAVKGVFPEKLFLNRSPNQTEKEYKYIKANHKQYTLPDFVDYINTVTRPFGDGNWAIDYREDEKVFDIADKTFRKYVESELPIYGSLEEFVKSILPTIKTIDANGFLGIRPIEIKYKETEEGEYTTDDKELFDPTIIYYPSSSVIDYKDGEYYLFLSKEKSEVEYGGKKVKEGNVFELYTEYGIYFFRQYGKKSDNVYSQELFFELLSPLPVIQLRGVPTIDESDSKSILWQSPFLFATDLLDLVLVNSNWLQFSVNKCVFPMTVMYGSPCEFKDDNGTICDNGFLNGYIGGLPYQKTCPTCNGSGLKGRLSPLGVMLIQPKTTFKEGETSSSQPPLSYISPSTETLDFIEKKIDKDTLKARQILKLRNRNSVVSEGKITATEVFDDAKGMAAFIKPIIDQIFYIYEFCLFQIGVQRYNDSFEQPSLSYPKSYDFKSTEDYLIDLTTAIDKGLDISFIKLLLFQFINSYYGDNVRTSRTFSLVMAANRLFGLSQDEINMKLAKGTAEKWESILNDSIYNFIDELLMADANFFEKELQEQVKLVQDKAKQVATAIGAGATTEIYNQL